MHAIRITAALAVLLASACSGGTAGSDSRDVTAQECRSYYEYTYRLDGMEAKAVLGEEQLAKDSATCAETGMVTRRHYDCAMAAKSVAALQACGAPNT